MSLKLCSFHDIVKGDCGASWGLETLFLLRDCNDGIGGHFVNCHLSTESLTETDLILVRASLFSVTKSQIEKMSICPRHWHSLGKFWRPPKSCQYPDHKRKSTAVGGRHVIGLKLSREIHSFFCENAAVGSCTCKYKIQFHYYSCSLKEDTTSGSFTTPSVPSRAIILNDCLFGPANYFRCKGDSHVNSSGVLGE